jgi:hypothetical protein
MTEEDTITQELIAAKVALARLLDASIEDFSPTFAEEFIAIREFLQTCKELKK